MTSILIRRPYKDTDTQRECYVMVETKTGVTQMQAKEWQGLPLITRIQERVSFRTSRRNQLCWHVDFVLLESRVWENKFMLFKSPNLWYFVMTALRKLTQNERQKELFLHWEVSCMLGTTQYTHDIITVLSIQPCKVDIIPILKMQKFRLRSLIYLFWGHIVNSLCLIKKLLYHNMTDDHSFSKGQLNTEMILPI